MKKLFVYAAILCLMGCGGRQPTAAELKPLSIESWKSLPATEKYTVETLDRLKAGEPSLQTPEGWERFQKTELASARKKDSQKGRSKS